MTLTDSWPATVPVRDQLDRTTESVVTNLVTAARLQRTEQGNGRFSKLDHRKFVEIAVDSGTKLAAYLDLAAAGCKTEVDTAKSLLREVLAMLTGLKGYLQDAR